MTAVHGADGFTIDGLVSDQATENPGTVAVRADGKDLTYAELVSQAGNWSAALHARGVHDGDMLVVRLPREPRLVAVLLGLLRLGASYLAVDPAWPDTWVDEALALTGGILLSDSREIPPAGASRHLAVSPNPDVAARDAPDPASRPSSVASIFLTSGSTGRPKAVLSPHSAAVHVLHHARFADLGPDSRMLQAAPLPWDAFTLELWGPLLNGGTCVLADDDSDLAARMRRQIARDGLTVVWLTASVFNALVDDDIDCLSGLREILTGGERLSVDHVERFRRRHPRTALTNGYGPCEATVFTSTHRVGASETFSDGDVPLGTPLPGVDVALDPRQPGQSAEILIGGGGLGYGYLGDPRATALAFVPRNGGQRYYRSGDAGRLDTLGWLRYEGRLDRQLKIRGQRVEPEELEALAREVLQVGQLVVGPVRNHDGEAVGLAVHAVPRVPGAATDDWWSRIDVATRKLPAYLRPTRLLIHENMPRLHNGKLDHAALEASAALPAAGAPPGATSGVAPPPDACLIRPDHGATAVAAAATELGVPVAQDDDLFLAGLDSLTVVRVLARLTAGGWHGLAPADVYRRRTPRALGVLLAGRMTTGPGAPAAGGPDAQSVRRPVYEMWLHEQLHPGDEASLVLSAFEIDAACDLDRLGGALAAVADRHRSLSSTLQAAGRALRLVPCTQDQLLTASRPREWPAGVQVCADRIEVPRDAIEAFDLRSDPPWRWHSGAAGGRLVVLFVLHHVAVDAWGEDVLLDEIGCAYRGDPWAAPASEPSPTAPSKHDPGFWAHSLRNAVFPVLPPPKGHPQEPAATPPSFILSAEQSDVIKARWGRIAASPANTLLLLTLATALAQLGCAGTAGEPVLLGNAYAGRDGSTARTVGLFVDILAIPVPLVRGPDACTNAMSALNERWLQAVDHRAALSLVDVAKLAPSSAATRRSPYPVVLGVQTAPPSDLNLGPAAPTRRLPVKLSTPPFDVFIEAWPLTSGGSSVTVHSDPLRVDGRWASGLCRTLDREVHRLVDDVSAS